MSIATIQRLMSHDMLKQVKDSELCSILAHELGHWARSHTLQMFVASNVGIADLCVHLLALR